MKRQKNGKERLMETKVNKSKVENKDTNKNSGNTENKRLNVPQVKLTSKICKEL